jgi:steroid delta-isomerase-like uncharacterized protein
MSAENSAISIAKQWFEQVWHHRDATAIHRLMAADVIGHLEGQEISGPEEFVLVFKSLLAAFPDFELSADEIIGTQDSACVRWQAKGTHTGAALGIPASHQEITFRGMTWLHVKDGLIVEGWDSWNQGALMASLRQV